MTKKQEKIMYLLEFIALLIFMTIAVIFKFLPEYKKNLGSSDSYLNGSTYKDLVEIKINSTPRFVLVINESDKVSNIFFLDEKAMVLYNQNIENKSIAKATKLIIEILIENNYLRQNDIIELSNYNNVSFATVKLGIQNELNKLNIFVNYKERKTSLEELGTSLELTATDEIELIKDIEIYSKNIVSHYVNNISNKNKTTTTTQTELTEKTAKEYCNNVYKNIENYINNNNIKNQDRNSSTLPINLIPADANGSYYPTTNSWYYVENSRVYAYVELSQNYSYCYSGSIDSYKKGVC